MSYDPLSYGEINLKGKDDKDPAGPAAAGGDSPDDILFQDAGPGFASEAPAGGDTWGSGAQDFDDAGPTGSPENVTQFGSDILGEDSYSHEPAPGPGAAYDPTGGAYEPATDLPVAGGPASLGGMPDVADPAAFAGAPLAEQMAQGAAPAPAPAPRLDSAPPAAQAPRSTPKSAPAARPAARPARRPVKRRSAARRRLSGMLAVMVPAVCVVGGGAAAGWLYMMQENAVMAGIIGGASLVAAAMGRLVFR